MSTSHAGMSALSMSNADGADPVSPKTTTTTMPDVSSLSLSHNAGNGAGANATEDDPATILSLRALVSTKEAGIIIGKFWLVHGVVGFAFSCIGGLSLTNGTYETLVASHWDFCSQAGQ
jgi:hypothetical protein